MAIDRGPWNALVDDDGSNLVGSVWNKAAIKTVILDPTDAALAANWVTVPFSPANFAGRGSLLWTVGSGNILTNRYIRIGNLVVWSVNVNGSSLGGTPNNLLHLVLPTGLTGAGPQFSYTTRVGTCSDGGGAATGLAYLETSTIIGIQKENAGNWSGSPCSVWLTISFGVT